MEEELLTATDLAQWLGKSVQALAQDRYRGVGPSFVRIGPRTIRYRRSDVENWLQANVHQAGSFA